MTNAEGTGISREAAEEYTQALGKIFQGSWEQIFWADRQGVPKALGLTTKKWVEQELGGYVRLAVEARREAVKRLIDQGLSTREAADILGVDNVTVWLDHKENKKDEQQAVENSTADTEMPGEDEQQAVENSTPDAEPAPELDDLDDDEPDVESEPDDEFEPQAETTPAPELEAEPAPRQSKSHADSYAERMAEPDELNEAPEPLYDAIVTDDALNYLRDLPDRSAHMCVTSPPYWAKRNYVQGDDREIGRERRPEQYVDRICRVVNEVGRVLSPRGVLFLNLGDTRGSEPGQYRGNPKRRRGISTQAIEANSSAMAGREHELADDKTWCLVPESLVLRLALDHGWQVVSKVVWHKIGHAPENVYDRLTQSWEPVYILARHRYPYFWRDTGDGRATDLWPIAVGRGGKAAGHPAPFPEELVKRAIRHGSPEAGVVLDPFAGSGTTLKVARALGRRFLGCDLGKSGAQE